MTSGREITPPPGFLAMPTTTTMFAATTPENMPLAYRASTSTNLLETKKSQSLMEMTDKESSAAGTDNRPPMLEESD
ncbi:hypothetical protein Tco_0719477 [Tanacetum coccineum]